MEKKSYSELLKDPKWQKKRLLILERDNWQCQECGDTESTLNVHHKLYKTGFKPWDYEDNLLITFCENCHNEIKEEEKKHIDHIYHTVKSYLFGYHIKPLADGLENMLLNSSRNQFITTSAFEHFIEKENGSEIMIDLYLDFLRKKYPGSEFKKD